MKNLVDEYFKRDLTEAEEQELAERLSLNPEEAEKLAKGMEGMYLKAGLPQPVWPGGHPPFGKSPWWVLKPLMPLFLVFVVIGFGAYKWLCNLPASEEPVSALPHHAQTLPEKLKAMVKSAKPVVKEAIPAIQANIPAGSTAPGPSQAQNPLKAVAPQTVNPQGHVYQEMSVAVAQATPGLVTVKVKDNLDTEVRILYAGILPAGNQTFTWDGKTDIGAVAPAGTYFIEVKSGETVQRKEINIQGGTLP